MKIDLPKFPIEGGCQCGALRYRINAAPLAVYNCHCRDCQRRSGAAHSMSMPIRRNAVELVAGVPHAWDKTADSGRVVRAQSCPICGVTIWTEPLAAPDLIVVKPGTLDDPRWAVPVGNIWTASALPWAEIDAALVNFVGQPPDRQPLYDAWSAATA